MKLELLSKPVSSWNTQNVQRPPGGGRGPKREDDECNQKHACFSDVTQTTYEAPGKTTHTSNCKILALRSPLDTMLRHKYVHISTAFHVLKVNSPVTGVVVLKFEPIIFSTARKRRQSEHKQGAHRLFPSKDHGGNTWVAAFVPRSRTAKTADGDILAKRALP